MGTKMSLPETPLGTQTLFFRSYYIPKLWSPIRNVLVRVRVTLRLAVHRQSVRLGANPLRPTTSNFSFQLNTCGYSPYVTSFLMREWVCRLELLLVLVSAFIIRSESSGNHDHILLSQNRDSSNLEGQVLVFISPRKRVARLYPQALGSLFVACYDSQGYGGGIWPRLHTEMFWTKNT
jgi:hypothetical protein